MEGELEKSLSGMSSREKNLHMQRNSILSMRQNPSDPTSPLLYSQEAMNKASSLIPEFEQFMMENHNVQALGNNYQLQPAPYGSIDVVWKLAGGTVFFNVPREGNVTLYQINTKVEYFNGKLILEPKPLKKVSR